MRHVNFAHAALISLLCGSLFLACRKNNDEPGPGPGPNPNGAIAKLLFHSSTQKQGAMPNGPAGAGLLKTSIKDTLYLTDQLLRPIKFLHLDTTKNVTGAYVQVVLNGNPVNTYYDVPEIDNMEESDTVSVITIGIDPTDLSIPESGEITIVPYDKNKQPITQIKKPVKVEENKVDAPSGGTSSCGLASTAGKWVWDVSYVYGQNGFAFWNEANKVHSAQGQDIEGSCCNGYSKWPEFCIGETKHNRKLHFATYYRIGFETFQFANSGSFFRQTLEDSPVPIPSESDFCSSGAGKVRESVKHTTYEGTWAIIKRNIPQNSSIHIKNDSLERQFTTTFSSGTGYGNPGGVLHQLDCKLGSLVLVQADREGGGRDLFKFYTLIKNGDSGWYN